MQYFCREVVVKGKKVLLDVIRRKPATEEVMLRLSSKQFATATF